MTFTLGSNGAIRQSVEVGLGSSVLSRDAVAGQLAITEFFGIHADPRYDLWNGGTGQAMVSNYLLFKHRYEPSWDVTMDLGEPFAGG